MMKTSFPVVLDIHCATFDKAYFNSDIKEEYLEFSRFWWKCFIISDYIIDTGNYRDVNREFIYRFTGNVADHPILWKLFRLIFGV